GIRDFHVTGVQTCALPISYGLGLAHWLYWPVYFKRGGLKLWLTFLDKFGAPTVRGTYPPNATAEEKQRLLAALEAVTSESGVIRSEERRVGKEGGTRGQWG